jgi:hypothetical protein
MIEYKSSLAQPVVPVIFLLSDQVVRIAVNREVATLFV